MIFFNAGNINDYEVNYFYHCYVKHELFQRKVYSQLLISACLNFIEKYFISDAKFSIRLKRAARTMSFS